MKQQRREILFRGKSIDNGKWLYGDYMRYAGGAQIWTHDADGETWNAIVAPDTVGRYSGLTDETGVKIFEGDILCAKTDSDEKVFVTVSFGEYDDDNAQANDHFIGWFLSFKKRWHKRMVNVSILNGQSINMLAIKMSEVIGNIHDNPELLEEAVTQDDRLD